VGRQKEERRFGMTIEAFVLGPGGRRGGHAHQMALVNRFPEGAAEGS
jgi:hypothetical protein